MMIDKRTFRRGLTLIELMVTVLAAMILIVGISAMIAHGHMGYRRLFNRVNSEVVRNAYEARRTFDRIARKSTVAYCELPDPSQIILFYYSDPTDWTIPAPDKYARFYKAGSSLLVDYGDLEVGTWTPVGNPSTSPLANNVQSVIFSVHGVAVRMVLVLDNETVPDPGVTKVETLKMTVTTTAIRHNH